MEGEELLIGGHKPALRIRDARERAEDEKLWGEAIR